MSIQNYNFGNDTSVMVSVYNNNTFDEPYFKVIHKTLIDAIFDSYNLLIRMKYNLQYMRITILHYNIPVTIFKIGYNNGLILYNEDNFIKACSIAPSFATIDMTLCKVMNNKEVCMNNLPLQKLLQTTDHHNNVSDLNMAPQKETICQKNITNAKDNNTNIASINEKSKLRHNTFIENAKIAQQQVPNVKINKPIKNKKFDEEFENKKEKERKERIEANRNNENLKVFVSDKKSYVLIKKDLEDGNLKRENMNPYFVVKYQIFKILDSRKSIDFTNDNNIKDEYTLYTTLLEACNDDNSNEDCSLINPKPIAKVYIPHNYQYMTQDKKEEYAKKYKMSLKQFEDKYINCMADDDIIENHINPDIKTPKLSTNDGGDIKTNDNNVNAIDKTNEPSDNINTEFLDVVNKY